MFELIPEGHCSGLLVGPGVQVLYATGNSSSGALVGPDVTIGLVAAGVLEAGVDLGVMEKVGLDGRSLLPWASLYAGFHF